jgi:hypothetical protein
MAITVNTLVSGYNLDPEFAGYASKLMQAIQRAIPESTFGMILVDSSTPDVSGAFSWRTRCLWIDTTVTAAPVLKAYRTTGSPGWFAVADAISNSTITTAMIQTSAVTLAKLYAPGVGEANKLIRVNAGGTGFELVTVASIIASIGNIPITSLNNTAVGATAELFVGCIGNTAGEVYWRDANDIAGLMGNAAVSPSKIGPAVVQDATKAKFLSSKTGDTYGVYRVIDPDTDIADGAINGDKLLDGSVVGGKLSNASVVVGKLAPGTNGYVPSTVAGAVVWVAPGSLNGGSVSALYNVPATTGNVTLSHGFTSVVPSVVRWVLVCTTAELGYSVNDELSIESAIASDAGPYLPAFAVYANTSNLILKVTYNYFSGGVPKILNATSTGYSLMTLANWRLKVYYAR